MTENHDENKNVGGTFEQKGVAPVTHDPSIPRPQNTDMQQQQPQHQIPRMYYVPGFPPYKHPSLNPEGGPNPPAGPMVKPEGPVNSFVPPFPMYRVPPGRNPKGPFFPMHPMNPMMKPQGPNDAPSDPNAQAKGEPPKDHPQGPSFQSYPPNVPMYPYLPMMVPVPMMGGQRPYLAFPGQRFQGNAINGIPDMRTASSHFESVAAALGAVSNTQPRRTAARGRQRARHHNYDSGDEDYEGPPGQYIESDRDNNSDEEFKAPGMSGAPEPRDGVRRSSRNRVHTEKYTAYAVSDSDEEEEETDDMYVIPSKSESSTEWKKPVRSKSRPAVKSREGRMTKMSRLTGVTPLPLIPESPTAEQSSVKESVNVVPETTTTGRRRAARVNYAEMDEALDSEDEGADSSQVGTERESLGGVDRVLDHRVDEETGETLYLIKWQGFSHIHNTWDTYESLRDYSGIKRVDNYIKRYKQLEEAKRYMTPDEIEQENISTELQRQIDEDALIAERIIAHWCETSDGTILPPSYCANHGKPNFECGDDSKLKNEKREERRVVKTEQEPYGEPVDDSDVKRIYVVKWRSCQYDQATEEEEETLLKHNFGPLILSYYDREDRISGRKALETPWVSHSMSLTKFEPYRETPTYLGNHETRKLRDYQLTGLNWMVNRMKMNMSVLLADEMGLGKTIQTISLVGHFIYREHLIGPYLIIVPQSTIDNWMRELETWLPNANAVCYYGNAASREIIRQREMCRIFVPSRGYRYKCDICVTTPSIINAPHDLDFLRRISWQLMVVDEAHQLKNRQSKRFIELMQFMADYKLLLSGTPLHNNLEELWTLLHFLNPSKYSYYEDFRRRYSDVENTAAIGESKQRQLLALQSELHEVVLRRVKKDVEKSLPNKIERILRVELSPTQIEWYRNILTRNYDQLSKSSGGSKSSLQNICMELKKVCNHPFLCHEPDDKHRWREGLVNGSGKICLLEKLLKRLKERGHRVLIFSQMVRMLNILSDYLTLRGYKHQRLDGTMGKEVRKKAMDHFNDPKSDDFCFLLSTKAGGLGINLTSADTVIIYDSDWNPQNDLQAEARAHRIGQTKTVQIYRLVTKDSVEQTILERAKSKMVLDTLVVQGLNKREDSLLLHDREGQSGFTREELSKILKFGASKLWSGDYNASGLDIDLDKVLEEAETSEDVGGAAADLLSSYTNITEFRYEPPQETEKKPGRGRKKGVDASADKEFWDATIPLEERVKLKKQQEEMIVLGPRKTRHRGDLSVAVDFSGDEEDEDFSGDEMLSRRRQALTKKKKLNVKKKPSDEIFDKDRVKLYRAIMKFGYPEHRLDDIRRDAKLIRINADVVAQECSAIITSAKRLVQPGGTRILRKKKPASETAIQVGDSKMSAADIVERLDVLDALRNWGEEEGGESWASPDESNISLPSIASEYFEYNDEWTKEADLNLLKGIYLHGFGNWTQICSDPKLGLEFAKTSKTDKVKSRAIRLLKFIHLYYSGDLTPESFAPYGSANTNEETEEQAEAKLKEIIESVFSGENKEILESLSKFNDNDDTNDDELVQAMKKSVPKLGDAIEEIVDKVGDDYPNLADECWKYVSKFTPASPEDLQRVYHQFCKNDSQ